MKHLLFILVLLPILAVAESAQPRSVATAGSCSDVMEQIQSAAAFVGPANYVVQLSRDKEARMILFLEQPNVRKDPLRWRLIERREESLTYCVLGEGKGLELLSTMHLANPSGRYGMPGSGHPRCAGKQSDRLPGSLDIRMWANKELGNSLVYSLPTVKGLRDYVVLFAADNTGAWIILDQSKNNLDDTCYYSRGQSSKIAENFRSK